MNDCAALLHELAQLQVAFVQQQAALLQLQAETVRLERLLIERVLGASTVDPEMTSDGVEREVVATEPAIVPRMRAMRSCARTRTPPVAEGPQEQSQHVLLALAYVVAVQAELGAVERAAHLVGVSEGLRVRIGADALRRH